MSSTINPPPSRETQEQAKGYIESGTDKLKQVAGMAGDRIEQLKEAGKHGVENVQDFGSSVGEWCTGAKDTVVEKAKDMTGFAKEKTEETKDQVSEKMSDIKERTEQTADDKMGELQEIAKKLRNEN